MRHQAKRRELPSGLRRGPQVMGRRLVPSGPCFAAGLALLGSCLAGFASLPATENPPLVVEIDLDDVVQPVSEEYVIRGISYANRVNAQAVLLELSTPGGLESSMRSIVQTIISS